MNKVRVQMANAGRMRDFGLMVLSRCGSLSETEMQAARAGLAEMQAVHSSTELLTEGTRLNRAQMLLEGWAVRQRVLSDGRRQIFSFLVPGDIFGISARPQGEAGSTIVTLGPATVAPLPFLNDALERAPASAAGRTAQAMLSLEESLLVSQVVRLGRQSAYERLISLLLEFHDRLLAVGLADDQTFSLPFTQEILSDALGLSTVHTNRTLQQLRREHLIETQFNQVKLLNIGLLAEISDYRRPPCLQLTP